MKNKAFTLIELIITIFIIGLVVTLGLIAIGVSMKPSQKQEYPNYHITVIEECQYIKYAIHGFTHKGNCTNVIHKPITKE